MASRVQVSPVATSSFSNGFVTASLPADPTPGNTIIAFYAVRDTAHAAPSTPAGFTQVGTVFKGPSFDGGNACVAYRVVQAGDGRGVTIAKNSSNNGDLYLEEWEGLGALGDVAQADAEAASSSLALGPVSLGAGSRVVFAFINQSARCGEGSGGAVPDFVYDSGFARSMQDGVHPSGPTISSGYKIGATGATSSVTVSATNNDGYGWLMAEFATTTPPPDPKVEITVNGVTFDNLLSKEIRVELNGPGSVFFTIDRGDAQATEANLARGNLIQVTIPEIHSDVLFEAFLEEGDFDLLSSDEEGGQELRFGGPGTLSYLKRAVVSYEEYLDGTGNWKPNKGMVVFDTDVTEGHIVNKLIREAQAAGRPSDPIPDLTKTFDATDDSNGDPWGDEVLEGKTKVRMGTSLYDAVLRLVRGGFLNVEMAPGLVLNLYRSTGVDRSSATFGAGKIRFVGGTNIVDELARGMAGRDFATHAYIRYDGGWTEAAKLTGSFPYEQELFYDASDVNHANTAKRAARGEMGWRETTQEALLLAHRVPWPGDDPDDAAGIYLPGPAWSDRGEYWVGDLVTVHTGSGEFDYSNATHRVYAITLRADETGFLAPPLVELNAPFLSADGTSGGLTASPIAGSSTGRGGGVLDVDLTGYQELAEKGQADGYPELNTSGVVPYAQLGSGGDGSGDHVLLDDGTWSPSGGSGNDTSLNTVAAAGATETLDVSAARTHDVTLTADCSVDFTGWAAGAWYLTAWFTEDGTGGWTPTLVGVTWLDGTPPAWDLAAGNVFGATVFSLDGGSTVYAVPIGSGGEPVADAHIADAVDAHDASAISAVTTGYTNSAGATVQAVLDDFDDAITAAAVTGSSGGDGVTDHFHVIEAFNGDGATTAFVIADEPIDADAVYAFVGGSLTAVTVSGTDNTTITFGSAPGAGTGNVVVHYPAVVAA